MVKKQCEKLVKKIALGEKEALAKLYEIAGRSMFLVALNVLKDYQRAEDATQDSLIKILNNACKLENTGAAYSWILTIARNCALDLLRKNGREIVADEDTYYKYPDNKNQNLELRIDMEKALSKLQEEDRQLVILKADGLSHKEIANILNITDTACQKRYQRAIKELKNLL